MSQPPPSRKRLEFGVDQLPEDERYSPAWPRLSQIEGRRNAAFTRSIHPSKVQIGGAEHPELSDAGRRESRHRAWARGVKRTPEYRAALAKGQVRWKEEEEPGDSPGTD